MYRIILFSKGIKWISKEFSESFLQTCTCKRNKTVENKTNMQIKRMDWNTERLSGWMNKWTRKWMDEWMNQTSVVSSLWAFWDSSKCFWYSMFSKVIYIKNIEKFNWPSPLQTIVVYQAWIHFVWHFKSFLTWMMNKLNWKMLSHMLKSYNSNQCIGRHVALLYQGPPIIFIFIKKQQMSTKMIFRCNNFLRTTLTLLSSL